MVTCHNCACQWGLMVRNIRMMGPVKTLNIIIIIVFYTRNTIQSYAGPIFDMVTRAATMQLLAWSNSIKTVCTHPGKCFHNGARVMQYMQTDHIYAGREAWLGSKERCYQPPKLMSRSPYRLSVLSHILVQKCYEYRMWTEGQLKSILNNYQQIFWNATCHTCRKCVHI